MVTYAKCILNIDINMWARIWMHSLMKREPLLRNTSCILRKLCFCSGGVMTGGFVSWRDADTEADPGRSLVFHQPTGCTE